MSREREKKLCLFVGNFICNLFLTTSKELSTGCRFFLLNYVIVFEKLNSCNSKKYATLEYRALRYRKHIHWAIPPHEDLNAYVQRIIQSCKTEIVCLVKAVLLAKRWLYTWFQKLNLVKMFARWIESSAVRRVNRAFQFEGSFENLKLFKKLCLTKHPLVQLLRNQNGKHSCHTTFCHTSIWLHCATCTLSSFKQISFTHFRRSCDVSGSIHTWEYFFWCCDFLKRLVWCCPIFNSHHITIK